MRQGLVRNVLLDILYLRTIVPLTLHIVQVLITICGNAYLVLLEKYFQAQVNIALIIILKIAYNIPIPAALYANLNTN